MTPGQSPWAGDDVPASSGAAEIVWNVDTPDPPSELSPPPPRRRSAVIATAAVAVIGLGITAVTLWPSGERSADSTPDTAPATPTTLDTLPPAVTTTTPTTSPVRTTVAPDRSVTRLPPALTIDVPAALASAVSTQIVALTSLGQVVSLDTRSGSATAIGLDPESVRGRSFGTEVIVASPDALMVSTSDGTILVVPDETVEPIAIDPDDFVFDSSSPPVQIVPIGWVRGEDDRSQFVVIAVEESSGRQREWLVDTDGNVALALAQRSGNFSTPVFAQGTRFLNDAGGAYRVDPDGSTQRVSNGVILASSANRILLRECDAQRVCNSVLRDHSGSDVAGVDLPPSFSPTFFAASLSPDGTAIASPSPTFDGTRTVYDLATGTTTMFEDQRLGPFGNSWATDSSGEFSLNNSTGLLFLDRSTGSEVSFASEFGEILAVTVRPAQGDPLPS